jgi:hypothetical protein
MIHRLSVLAAALLIAGSSLAPAARAREPRGHDHPAAPVRHGGIRPGATRYDGGEHHGGDAAAAAIIGGLIGLGIGAAITSGGAYPPGYTGPPPGYYGPPPGVYYGY